MTDEFEDEEINKAFEYILIELVRLSKRVKALEDKNG